MKKEERKNLNEKVIKNEKKDIDCDIYYHNYAGDSIYSYC